MSMLGGGLEQGLLQLILNGDVSAANNPMGNALSLAQVAVTGGNGLWMGLHTSVLTANDTLGAEPTSGEWTNYARVEVKRAGSDTNNGSAGLPTTNINWSIFLDLLLPGYYATNVNAIQFPAVSGGSGVTVTHWGMWDASSGGRLVFWGPLTASGAIFKVGVVTAAAPTTQVFSPAHGFTLGTETIRIYALYNGAVNGISGAALGVPATVNTITSVDEFQTLAAFGATLGAFLYVQSSSLAVSTGKIPNFPASSLLLRVT